MSRYPPLSTKYAWDRNPTPHAPPAITVPPPDYPIEPSHFSPESQRSSTHSLPRPTHARSQSAWTNTATVKSVTRDPELGKTTPPQTPHFRDRFTKLFFDIRMPTQTRRSEWVPMSEPRLRSWPPLEIEKRKCCDHCKDHNSKRHKWRKVLIKALIALLLFLLGNTIFLNVRVAQLSSRSSSTSSSSTSSSGLSADAQQCLSQFSLNAPDDPESYPCSTCLSTLQNISSTSSTSGDNDQIANAIQFCGLRSIFDDASGDGQQGLSNGGWAKDVRFCAWSGVRCDGFGRVSSIQLSFPAVPSQIPAEISALTGLTSLEIVGDTNIPAGAFPTSFKALSELSTLNLESTAVSSIASGSLTNLSTLTLVKNAEMTGDMTSLLTSLPLTNLVINSQPLQTDPISALLSSSAARTLQTLDLSSTSLSGTLPDDLSGFTALRELHLDSNALSSPLPSKFPANLDALTLTNNTQLSGTASFCTLSGLQACDARGTALSAAQGGCGPCQFGNTTTSA